MAILHTLQRERNFLSRRTLASVAGKTAVVMLLPLVIVALLDHVMVLRETLAFSLAIGLGAVAGLVVFVNLIRAALKLPSQQQVALMLENDCPELMDSLVCASELLREGDTSSAFHDILLEQVETKLQAHPVRETIRARVSRGPVLAGVYLLALAAVVFVGVQPISAKATAHFMDLVRGEQTGLNVSPGDVEIALGEDFKIRVEIQRGPDQAHVLIENERGSLRYEMFSESEQIRLFDLFAVDGAFTYQVVTPTLSSPIFKVSTYEKPRVKSVLLSITPPAYTNQAARELRELKDIAVPAGSTLNFAFETNIPAGLALAPSEGDELAAEAGEGNIRTLNFVLTQTETYGTVLTDSSGRRTESDQTFQIEAIPDFPPTVHFVSPDDDASYKEGEDASFMIKVEDDYGVDIVVLHYAINGDEWEKMRLYKNTEGNWETDTTVTHLLVLDDYVVEGDVIAYYAVAVDNAQPEANASTSDVRFLDIRPDLDKPLGGEMPGGGQPPEELGIHDLIVEQKHLIRSTFSTNQLPAGDVRNSELAKVAKSAAQLKVTANKRYADLKEKAGDMSLGEIGKMFEDALAHMDDAARLLDEPLPEESLPYQQRALAKLIQLEIELEKNSQRMKGKGEGEGEGGESSDEEERQPETLEQENVAQEREEEARKLKDFLLRLDDLLQRQENVNVDLRSRGQDRIVEGYQKYLQRRQSAVQGDTDELGSDLRQVDQGHQVAGELRKASNSMSQGLTSVSRSQVSTAAVHGERAHQFLERAREMLAGAIDEMEGDRIQQAQRMLTALRDEQRRLREQSEKLAQNSGRKSPGASPSDAGDQQPDGKKPRSLSRDEPDAGQEPGDQQAGDQPGGQKPGGQQQTGTQPGGQKPGGQQPGGQKPGGQQPGGQQAGTQPGGPQPGGQQPGGQQAGANGAPQPGGQPSGAPSREQLMAQQKGLREAFDDFMKNLGDLSGELEDSNPGAASELANAMNAAREKNITGDMKRAENALRYRRADKAADYQEQVERDLDNLAGHLDAAGQKGDNLSNEELSKMLESVLEDADKARELGENPGGEGEEGEGEGEGQGEGEGEQQASAGEGQGEGEGKGKGQGKGEGEGEGEGEGKGKGKGEGKGDGEGQQLGGSGGLGSGDTNRPNTLKNIRDNVGGIASKLGDAKMNSIAAGIGEANGGHQVVALLHEAARVIEEKMLANALKDKLELTRLPGSQAPDEYRKLVNEYFKTLSDGAVE